MKPILKMKREEILNLNPDLVSEEMTHQQVEHIFSQLQAFWKNDGDFSKPHVKLTSGRHSNGYINCRAVLQYKNLREIMARQMIIKLYNEMPRVFENWNPDNWIIGSATSATNLAGSIAEIFGCRHGILKKGSNKEQSWQDQIIKPGEKILLIEELMTTAFTAKQVQKGIIKGNSDSVDIIEIIPVLIYRSKKCFVNGLPILPVFCFDIQNYEEDKCPFCRKGSPVLENPKENWDILTA